MKKIKLKWLILGIIGLVLIVASIVITNHYLNNKTQSTKHVVNQVKELWTCTMHPQVISDKPGQCPICGMDLVRKISDDSPSNIDLKNMIKLSDNKLILANVSTVKVEKIDLNKTISVYSYLDFAEQNSRIISARFNGRIEKLYVDKTGQSISKGQALFDIYSPDLVQAQNEYLIALGNSDKNSSLLNSARKKLQIFGMLDQQIKELETKKEVKMVLTYHSTFSGTVIEKKIKEGMYINEGMELYNISDLSVLWDIAEINESDLNVVQIGSKVQLKIQSYPSETFYGRVSLIYPVISSQTRTVKIRSEFINSGGKLKPQMYGDAQFERNFGKGVAISSDAVLIMGKKNIVWLKAGDGMFEPKEVTLGMKIGDKYQVLSGLNEGDEVAVTGGFLIDSESQLRSGLPTSGHQHDSKELSPPPMPSMEENKADHSAMPEPSSKENTKKESIVRKGVIDLEAIDKNGDSFVYQDLMDWNVISDKPGICPLCKMKLSKVTLETAKQNLIKHNFQVK